MVLELTANLLDGSSATPTEVRADAQQKQQMQEGGEVEG